MKSLPPAGKYVIDSLRVTVKEHVREAFKIAIDKRIADKADAKKKHKSKGKKEKIVAAEDVKEVAAEDLKEIAGDVKEVAVEEVEGV